MVETTQTVNRDPVYVAFENLVEGKATVNCRKVASGIVPSHLFRFLVETSLNRHFQFVPLQDAAGLDSIVLLPVGLSGGVDHWNLGTNLEGLDTLMRQCGNLRLVLDYSWEGVSNDGFFSRVESELESLKLPLNRVTLLLSSVNARELYHRYCLTRKRSSGDRMAVMGYHFFMLFSCVAFRRQPDRLVRPEKVLNSLTSLRNYRFLSLNRRPRRARLALGLKLYSENYVTKGLVSMPSPDYASDHFKPQLDFDRFFEAGEEGAPDRKSVRDQFLESLPWNLDIEIDNSGHTDLLTFEGAPPEAYYQTYFSIVTETGFGDNPEKIFITEKTCKALVNLHPVLLMGDAGSLQELRRMGFRTYAELFDEGYDDLDRPHDRLRAIFNELDKVMRTGKTTLHDSYERSLPDLLHNRDLILNFPEHHGRELMHSLLQVFQVNQGRSV